MGKILSFKRGLGMTDKELLKAIGLDDRTITMKYTHMLLKKVKMLVGLGLMK